ncbi:hypothetical protein AB0K34_37145 [Actinomadura sp. NPDC049382]|uniref:hypothetical protein n=1 Tax=Actinomadura sp. NPDC049382 TaxID=3158220 RepID=UPI00341CEF4B
MSQETDPTKRTAPAPLQLNEVVYEHGHTREVLPYDKVVKRYGPVRPVIGAPSGDYDRLQAAIRGAGRTALGRIAAALHAVEQQLQAEKPPPVPTSGPIQPEQLVRRDPLTAGRPGSWEAGDFLDLVWTVSPNVGGDELDEELYRVGIEVFTMWATSPAGYVEFAETLPSVLADVVDEGDGVGAIAQDWLLDLDRIRVWAASKTMNHAGY